MTCARVFPKLLRMLYRSSHANADGVACAYMPAFSSLQSQMEDMSTWLHFLRPSGPSSPAHSHDGDPPTNHLGRLPCQQPGYVSEEEHRVSSATAGPLLWGSAE